MKRIRGYYTVRWFRKIFTLFVRGIIFPTACEKDITLDILQPDEKIVVAGYIEQGCVPYVLLTRNAPFFSNFNADDLAKYVIKNALVTVSDGLFTDTLKEVAPGFLDGIYFGTIPGEVGKRYTLKVRVGNEEVSTVTSILTPIPLDSIWFRAEPGLEDKGFAYGHLRDPDTSGNWYRLFRRSLQKYEDFIAPFSAAFDDRFINGQAFDFPFNRDDQLNFIPDGLFSVGDTIVVKCCSIDPNTFRFWRTLENELTNGGNPFAAPTAVLSNVEGGLGIWGGYGATFDTIVAVK